MKYRILVVEKPRSAFKNEVHYENCRLATETLVDFLNGGEYIASAHEGLESVTETEYASAHCVLVHPTFQDMPRLKNLRDKYTHVGIIISPGCSQGGAEYQVFRELERDVDRVYILLKPIFPEALEAALQKVIGFKVS